MNSIPIKKLSSNIILVGQIRISVLSGSLLRIEEAWEKGFEDRPTFLVVNRDWPIVPIELDYKDAPVYIKTSGYQVMVQGEAESIKDVKVYDAERKNLLWSGSEGIPDMTPFPQPGKEQAVFILPDKPRIVPPPWGSLPPPTGPKEDWEAGNDVPDIYIFVYNADLSLLRRDFLKLTGSVPIPPLWAFGFWNSLYHAYTDKEALETIKRYRKEKIPLDVFVVDTDWRVGGSTGYDIEKKYFPDMKRFLKRAHSNNVKILFNDHPSSRGMKPVESAMLRYRYENLTKFLKMGLDTWWYDKNWFEFIDGPGIEREVWGQYLYWGIINHFRPGMRSVLLSMQSTHPASHRYPIWWTGDIHSSWDDLRDGIKETLWFGSQCMPYVGQDLGGHLGNPDDELYTRFLQYGCLSPTARVHGSVDTRRYPWLYSCETQRIVTEYIKLRYRLLPTIYSAARRAYEDGTPLLRHPEWPDYSKGDNHIEYLLGEDLLVAPVYTKAGYSRLDEKFLCGNEGNLCGLKGEYFSNPILEGKPELIRIDREISFPRCFEDSVVSCGESFSVRWTGKFIVPQTGLYTFRTLSSDGVRLWIGDTLLIDNWTPHHQTYDTGDIELAGDTCVPLRLEYFNGKGFWIIRLDWSIPVKDQRPLHELWIPPGQWEDLWTGEILEGPQEIVVESPLYKTPVFVRRGGIIILSPEMDYTGQKPWTTLILEIFVPEEGKISRTLYEDDGETLEYQSGGFRKTEIVAFRESGEIGVKLADPVGYFRGAPDSRSWIVRVHLKPDEISEEIFIDRRKLQPDEFSILMPKVTNWPWMPLKGAGSNPPHNAGQVVEVSLLSADEAHEIRVKVRT